MGRYSPCKRNPGRAETTQSRSKPTSRLHCYLWRETEASAYTGLQQRQLHMSNGPGRSPRTAPDAPERSLQLTARHLPVFDPDPSRRGIQIEHFLSRLGLWRSSLPEYRAFRVPSHRVSLPTCSPVCIKIKTCTVSLVSVLMDFGTELG